MRSTWNEGRFGSPFFATRASGLQMSGGTRRFLGQELDTTPDNAQEWYDLAKAMLVQWETLRARVEEIASPPVKLEAITWMGDRGVDGTPFFVQARVDFNFRCNAGASYNPVTCQGVPNEGIGAYNKADRQSRVLQLMEINEEFKGKVAEWELRGGIRPAAQIRERIVTVPGTTAPGPDLTVPILIGAGAIAAALLLF